MQLMSAEAISDVTFPTDTILFNVSLVQTKGTKSFNLLMSSADLHTYRYSAAVP